MTRAEREKHNTMPTPVPPLPPWETLPRSGHWLRVVRSQRDYMVLCMWSEKHISEWFRWKYNIDDLAGFLGETAERKEG